MAEKVSALILAGGQSSRMGTDKAVLQWQGSPLIRRVYDVASQCCESVKILTPWPDRYADLLPASTQFLREANPGKGPVWAIHQGLLDTQTNWILVLACDMPCLQVDIIQQWCSLTHTISNTVMAIAPRQEVNNAQRALKSNAIQTPNQVQASQGKPCKRYRWEPLCALYRRSAAPSLTQFLASAENQSHLIETQQPKSRPKLSLQRWLDQLSVHPIPITNINQQMFHNCNRPSDFNSGQFNSQTLSLPLTQ